MTQPAVTAGRGFSGRSGAASVRAMMSSTYPVPLVHSSGVGLRSTSQ
jgi:hypothetical protein